MQSGVWLVNDPLKLAWVAMASLGVLYFFWFFDNWTGNDAQVGAFFGPFFLLSLALLFVASLASILTMWATPPSKGVRAQVVTILVGTGLLFVPVGLHMIAVI